MFGAEPHLRRQYFVVAMVIAVLVVGIFAVFAQLLTGQLSRSYLEDVLLSGKVHAEEVARQFTGTEPTYRVLEQRREELYKLSAALTKQEIVESVKFFDERGKLAFQIILPSEGYRGTFPEGHTEFVVPSQPEKVTETESTWEISVPLEDYGTVVMALSKRAMAARIAVLRNQLLLHTATAGVLTVLVLGAAIAFIWHLIQRNAMLEERRRRDLELAALGSLAANLAHEIRNPLNALSLNLEILGEELTGRGDELVPVGQARREVGRLSKLVNDFLVYARPSRPVLEPVSARELVREAAGLLGPTCERSGVELHTAEEDVVAWLDRAQMSQVLMNLAVNAIQAMNGEGRRRLEIRARTEGDAVVFEVADSGPGIPEADLPRVRDAFFSRRKGGTGLGLSIADRIVQEHGGTLELRNAPGGGLVARVQLPVARQDEQTDGRSS